MTVKQTSGGSLREYVAKFNMIALETPTADAKIKIHAFIQGLRSGPFFDSLVMNEPQDFGELLKRITPFIHLEEARLARQEETDKGRKKGEKRTDRDDVEEGERRIRNQIPRGSFRYDNQPREYQGGPPRTKEPVMARGMQQLGPAMPILSREVREISEKELIPLNRPLGDILETARRVSGFTVPWGYTEQTRGIPSNVVCTYHNQHGHHTDRCKTLRLMIDKIVREGKLRQFVGEKRGHPVPQGRGNRNNPPPPPPPPPGLPKQKIFMIFGREDAKVSNHTRRTAIRQARQVENTLMEIKPGQAPKITFSHQDDRAMLRPHNDALVITIDIAGVWVARTFVDTGSSVNVIYYDCLKQLDMNAKLQPSAGSLFGFSGEMVTPIGSIHLPVTLGSPPVEARKMVEFVVLDLPNSAYNIILGRPALNAFQAVVSTYYLKIKFPAKEGVGEICGSQVGSKECYVKAITARNKRGPLTEGKREPNKRFQKNPGCLILGGSEGKDKEKADMYEQSKWLQMEPEGEILNIELFAGKEGFTTRIGKGMKPEIEERIVECLRKNADVFAFSPSDLKGIDTSIAMHVLHEDIMVKPVKQKLRRFGTEKDETIREEVTKLLTARHIIEVQFPIWLSNVVMVSKGGGKWRMCVDFRDLNRACPKDHYPLPRIDQLVDSTSGCELLSMMDAYQGYHQIKMYPEDVAKTAFGTAGGVFDFTSMPFGLKNAGATYQRMMDSIFQKQIGKNLAYM